MSGEAPDWMRQFADAVAQTQAGLQRVGSVLVAQGIMGWMFQGEFDKALDQMAKLPKDQVELLAMASRALAELADEHAKGRS